MKRLCFCLALLMLVFSATLAHIFYLGRLTDEICLLLTRTAEITETGDLGAARALAEEALDLWNGNAFYLHAALRHNSIDEIHVEFAQLMAFLDRQELDQLAATNQRLLTQLSLLYEMEQLTLQNIL